MVYLKRFLLLVVCIFLLTGCSKNTSELSRAVSLREELLSSKGCNFTTTITADYGAQLYTFQMDCTADSSGEISFRVIYPESICDITGKISANEGKLTFDDKALLFDVLADGQLTPVSAPMLLIKSLRSGYIKACGTADRGLYIQIDDSYANDSIQIDIWTDSDDKPTRAEFLWKGKRFLSMTVESFTFL